jgi:hypothetical protein
MAITINLSVDQGADFEATIKLYSSNTDALNLTGYGFSGQIRRSYESQTTSAVFTITSPNPTNGELTLSLSDTTTAAMRAGRYVYDIIITDTSTGVKTRAAEGIVTVMPGVTR